MLQLPAGRKASRGERAPQYERHRPEQTLLHQLVEEYHPAFEAQWAVEGRVLPDYVRQEFDEYLKCGRLEHGFLRVQCETCRVCGGAVRVIACIEDPVVIKKILAHLEEKSPPRAALLLPDSRAPP
jgi:hypothetical protein